VDPGIHRVSASAPGFSPWEHEVTVGAAASSERVSVPALAATGPVPTPPPAEPATPTPISEPAQPQPQVDLSVSSDDGEAMRIGGLVAIGVGVVAVGVGGIFGLEAISKNGDAEDKCGAAEPCADPEGFAAYQDAKDAAGVADILVVGGLVVAAAGTALFFLAPSEEQPEVTLGVHPEGAAIRVGGVF